MPCYVRRGRSRVARKGERERRSLFIFCRKRPGALQPGCQRTRRKAWLLLCLPLPRDVGEGRSRLAGKKGFSCTRVFFAASPLQAGCQLTRRKAWGAAAAAAPSCRCAFLPPRKLLAPGWRKPEAVVGFVFEVRRTVLWQTSASFMEVTFEDVAVYFCREEWAELIPWQKELYRGVMVENYEAVLSVGRLSVKPEIISKIEREEAELCVGEFWKPPQWRDPSGQWLGDGIRMADDEDLERAAPIRRRRGRRKKVPSSTTEKQMAIVPPKDKGAPKLTLKMKPAKCPECGKSFLSNVAMAIHIRTHTGERPFKCHLCPKGFPSRGDLKRHIKTHLRPKRSPPTPAEAACGGKKRLAAKLQLLSHLQRPPDPRKPHVCAQCGKGFGTPQSLRKHQGTHSTERPFSCAQCGSSFRLKQILVAHMDCHATERPYPCQECGKTFVQERGLRSHQLVHTGEKCFLCEACGRRFAYKQHFLKHLRLHTGERPYSCAECGKTFRDRATLSIHNRMHTGERPYSCPFCGKACRQKQHLNSHLKVHRGEVLPPSDGTGRALQKAKEKPHACPRCEKRFRDKRIMRAHLLTHEQESLSAGDAGPAQAEAKSPSGRGGGRKQPTSLHATAPPEKLPFGCAHCGRKFPQRKSLLLHQRSHR
ncbi:zinc finger protein 25-like isoform X2 [Podarcis raffonei]|uniref:zinc finger protein 25-like isoform X2 n=1 Tax=Podarcis raffonei TaxID=65483 RepID=UPI0023293CB9|nr:zinc finger protein 25-like isoform X2 [Podarcis raffonei]